MEQLAVGENKINITEEYPDGQYIIQILLQMVYVNIRSRKAKTNEDTNIYIVYGRYKLGC